jgi:hypothetical protein
VLQSSKHLCIVTATQCCTCAARSLLFSTQCMLQSNAATLSARNPGSHPPVSAAFVHQQHALPLLKPPHKLYLVLMTLTTLLRAQPLVAMLLTVSLQPREAVR